MEHEAILKWAAGSAQPLPPRVEFDEAVLIDLVTSHNLPGRFLRRLNNEAPLWATPSLQSALRRMHEETRTRIMEYASAFRELSGRLPAGTRAVIIKGMSTYALSRQEHAMRCGDMDLFSNDNDAVSRILLELGYKQTRGPFLYELAEYRRGAVEIDLHQYYPVYFYSPTLAGADLRPEQHPLAWSQNYQLGQHEITYDELSRTAVRSDFRETEGVNVPDPNLLALIICSHAFLNFTNIWSISHREKTCIRLGELADLFDLAAHPSFSPVRFLNLVGHFGGRDAIEWAAHVVTSLFGRNPLPVPVSVRLGDALPDGRFPRCLWWNFWLDFHIEIDDLLRRYWLDLRSLMTQFRANILPAVAGRTARYSTRPDTGSKPLRRFLTQAEDASPIPLELEVSKSGRGLRLELRVSAEPEGDRVRVDFGHVASEWIHSRGESQTSLVGAPAVVSFDDKDVGYELSLEFSWETLGRSVSEEGEMPLLVGVGKPAQRGGLVASTMVPLKVSFVS